MEISGLIELELKSYSNTEIIWLWKTLNISHTADFIMLFVLELVIG